MKLFSLLVLISGFLSACVTLPQYVAPGKPNRVPGVYRSSAMGWLTVQFKPEVSGEDQKEILDSFGEADPVSGHKNAYFLKPSKAHDFRGVLERLLELKEVDGAGAWDFGFE